MKKLIIILAASSLLGSGPLWAHEGEQTQQLKVQIEGMVCSLCAARIKKNWSSLCKESSVDWKSGVGMCSYEEGKATEEQILKAVEEAGFQAKKNGDL